MKNSIKRAQSQACLGFAERKNFRPLAKLKKLTMTLALLIMAVGGAWADGIVCTASDLGKVLCTDGSIYENVSAATTAGKTAVAMIAYVDETNKNGLAIALADESGKKNYEDAGTACSGKAAVTGGTWRLPSDKDWQYMFIGCGSGESYSAPTHEMSKSYSGLASKLTTAQGAALQTVEYWSSTKDDPNGAWIVVFGGSNATFYMEDKTVEHQVRACLAFDIAEPTEWSLTPDTDKKVWTLAKMPANDVELQVEYEPTKVTMAVNDKTMGTAEVAGESKVEWTADTWKGWTSDTKEYTVDDITMTSTQNASIRELTDEGDYLHSLSFFVREMVDDATVTFSTTGDPFSRIEFTMIRDYNPGNGNYHGIPNIQPADGWTFEGKNAVWEGEATKSLTLQSCSTQVSKITFFKGATPDGVTINGDGTFTVAKTATVTLKATPAEGYKFLYWEDDQTNTNPVREVTIESGMADMTYKAVFAEITYNVTFVEGTNPDPENPEWTATPNPAKTKQTVTVTYTGSKKVLGVKAEKKAAAPTWDGPIASEATAADYGKVVCAAGHLHDAKTAVPEGCTAVAIFAYIDGGNNRIAIALQDAEAATWNTITNSGAYKDALCAVPGTWNVAAPTDAEWFVGTKAIYEAIFTNLGSTTGDSDGKTYDANVNAYITTGVGGAAISGQIWSTTYNAGSDGGWIARGNFWGYDYRSETRSVRPVLGF